MKKHFQLCIERNQISDDGNNCTWKIFPTSDIAMCHHDMLPPGTIKIQIFQKLAEWGPARCFTIYSPNQT